MNQPNQNHITIFGDESVNNNIVCYSVIVFKTEMLLLAENILEKIKDEFGVPKNYFLHAKELFNGHERSKLEFTIDIEKIKNLYLKIANEFQSADKLCCYADKRMIKKNETINWDHNNRTEIYNGDKELIHWCKNGAMIDVVRFKKQNEYSFIPDPDNNSRMKWGNKKKAKVNNQDYNMIISADTIDYPSHPDDMIRLKQINIHNDIPKPSLIQIADFLAYSFAKAKTIQESKDKQFFIEIINIMKPISRFYEFN